MRLRISLLFLLAGVAFLGAREFERVRMPSAAGVWYPADADALRTAVLQYIQSAPTAAQRGRVVGCVMPHSSYPNAGGLMAAATKPLAPGQYDRVIILTGSHYAKFRGCSIPAVQFYRTPLGDVPLDGETVQRLSMSTLINTRAVIYRQDAYDFGRRAMLHEREHGIEVVLPFLQEQLGEFRLVPIVVGEFQNLDGSHDGYAIEAVARSIKGVIDDRTLVVVSTHFTHYGSSYGYRPPVALDGSRFPDNIQGNIEQLDRLAFRFLTELDYTEFGRYVRGTQNPIDGKHALDIFMRLFPNSVRGELVGYTTSGRLTGNSNTSVSYGAFVFTDPTARANQSRPVRRPAPEDRAP